MGHRFRRLISAAIFVRLAISILLALVIWGFIVWETNPEITRQFDNIAISAENVPANMLVVGGLPSTSVTLKGPEDVVQRVVPSDLAASIDFSAADGPGIDEYEINVDAPSGVRRIIVEPSLIEVELDLIVTRTFQVALREDEARPASVTSIAASTEVAYIQGPQDLVDRVDAIVLPVELAEQRESFSRSVPLVPVSADGTPVDGVEVSPASVELTVTFESTSRDVPVIVKCACIVNGQLAETELSTAAAIPSTVRLTGPSSALADLGSIETVPVDISQLDQSGWILDVELNTQDIPTSVGISNTTVDVWVPVAPTRLDFPDVEIKPLGLGENLRAELAQTSAFILVSGNRDALDDPDEIDVMAVVDLSGLATGTYTIDVEVVVPAGVTYEHVTPETVTVVISPATTTANRLQDATGERPEGVR